MLNSENITFGTFGVCHNILRGNNGGFYKRTGVSGSRHNPDENETFLRYGRGSQWIMDN